jgi:uncharacterized protein YjiK
MQDVSLPYKLREPDETFKLSDKLKEISGITCYKKKYIVAVQDEKGKLFLINRKNGEIKKKITFSADGDYEDVVLVGDLLYAVRSDGVLFEISDWRDEDKITTKVLDTNLGEMNDTEGITYHAPSNALWVACKASGKIGEQEHGYRSVYQFELDTMAFDVEPVFTISRKQFKQYLKKIKGTETYDPLKREMKEAKKDMPIRPAAIAIHPKSNDIYILSAVGNMLLVLNAGKEIRSISYLSPDQYEQPEGITFDKDANLYIASEGRKKKARLYRFDYQK